MARIAPGVEVPTVSDRDLAIVAGVARREGWTDLARPPEAHSPRTLDEQQAVARLVAAIPPPARRRGTACRARLLMLTAVVAVLGACWWVSPARTAIGLLGAGVFCLLGLRRTRRRSPGRARRMGSLSPSRR